MRQQTKYWRVNEAIRAPKVRVIGANGKQLGVLTNFEAQKAAKKAELDLVEIAAKADPPVVKIVDFGKFKYSEEKKTRKNWKKTKALDVKEIRFSPFIADGDYKTRMARVKSFFKDGHKVRAVVKFKGRQMGSKTFGYNLLKKIITDLDQNVSVDMEPKFLGRHLVMVISPTKKGSKNNAETKN